MWLFYFLFWTAVRAREGPLYGKIGDKAVLTTDSEVNPITSIEWKHGADLAMEWYGGETISYRHFKVRGSLNISTGALTITGLTPDDSGIYTVEINNKVTSKTQLLVISPVSKPTISEWCTGTYCVLTCNGNTTGAEPVTYRWTSGDTTLSSTKEHNITKENKEPWFSCAFQNPVSNISSEKVFNPFKEKDLTWIYIVIAVFTPVMCIIIIIIYFRHKGIINLSCKWIKGETVDGTKEETTGMLTSVEKTSTQDLESPDTSNETERPASLVVVQETSPQDTTSTGPPETSKETGKAANGTVREREVLLPIQDTSTQDPTSVVVQDTHNETERPASLVEETSTQDKTSTGPPETSKETERSTTSPDVPETSTQDQETAESPDPSNETEMSVLPPPLQNTSTQDLETAESPDTSNETVISTISEVNETSTQDLETAESPDTRNETERPASPVVVQETSSQDTTSTGPLETSKETETTGMLTPVEDTSTQDPTSVLVQDTSNETVNSTISEVNETSTQDLETAESPDTSNETERPASPVVVQETSNQDTTFTGPPETSKETERSTTSPDVPETSTQDLETAESPDPSNETEMSVLPPPLQNTSTQDQETAESPDTSNETETNNQRKPCRSYNEGGCWKGDSCHYRHVCEFALKGNCPNGSNCRMKHPGGTKPQWQFEGVSGTWFIYKRGTTECSVNSDEIERKYQKNPNSKMPFTVNRNYYELDFEAKIQINLMTKNRRRVRRVLL